MFINQLTFLITFIYMVQAYSYILIPPSILLSNNSCNEFIKVLCQTFNTIMLTNAFNTKFYMAKSEQNIEMLINQNRDLVDILVCNHASTFDFLIVMSYLQKFNIGSFNFVLKNEITYFPGFGLVMYANSDIKLNRNWDQDKKIFGKQIDNIKTSPTGNKQVLLIFPEGTRLTKEKLEKAKLFSQQNNLPVFNNLLVPKTKGLWYLINHLEQKKQLGRIWDITLAIPKFMGKSAYVSDLLGKSIGPVYGIFRELELPENNVYQDLEKFKDWFLKTWKIKDDFLENYTKFIYNPVIFDDQKNNHLVIISSICILFTLLLSKKYGRYYLLLSLILSYILIIFKL